MRKFTVPALTLSIMTLAACGSPAETSSGAAPAPADVTTTTVVAPPAAVEVTATTAVVKPAAVPVTTAPKPAAPKPAAVVVTTTTVAPAPTTTTTAAPAPVVTTTTAAPAAPAAWPPACTLSIAAPVIPAAPLKESQRDQTVTMTSNAPGTVYSFLIKRSNGPYAETSGKLTTDPAGGGALTFPVYGDNVRVTVEAWFYDAGGVKLSSRSCLGQYQP